MQHTTIAFLFAFLVACSPSHPLDDDDNDSSGADVVQSLYDPAVNWKTCGSAEDDHACNIISFDHNGNTFDLYQHYGSLIVLDLSAMWCGPCNQAGSHAQAVQDAYAGDDLIYVTVLIDDLQGNDPDLDDLQHWATSYGNTTSPVVAGKRTMLQSSGGAWGLTSWPTFFYIDREMVIRDVDKGYSSTEVSYSIEWLLTL